MSPETRIAVLMSLQLAASAALAAGATGAAADLAPTGTLRATYIGSNPVQAIVDPATGETRGPAMALTAGLAKRAGVAMTISAAANVQAVIDSVRNGTADIGFVAYDAARAEQVDFSQTYALAQNTYLVTDKSPIRAVADVDRAGTHVGVTARDAGDTYLTRTLKAATLTRSESGIDAQLLKSLQTGGVQAIAGNRMRLTAIAKATPGLRVVVDNFYGVEQAIIVSKGNAARLTLVNQFIDEARSSGLIADSIARAGLVGADVAPPGIRAK